MISLGEYGNGLAATTLLIPDISPGAASQESTTVNLWSIRWCLEEALHTHHLDIPELLTAIFFQLMRAGK